MIDQKHFLDVIVDWCLKNWYFQNCCSHLILFLAQNKDPSNDYHLQVNSNISQTLTLPPVRKFSLPVRPVSTCSMACAFSYVPLTAITRCLSISDIPTTAPQSLYSKVISQSFSKNSKTCVINKIINLAVLVRNTHTIFEGPLLNYYPKPDYFLRPWGHD